MLLIVEFVQKDTRRGIWGLFFCWTRNTMPRLFRFDPIYNYNYFFSVGM